MRPSHLLTSTFAIHSMVGCGGRTAQDGLDDTGGTTTVAVTTAGAPTLGGSSSAPTIVSGGTAGAATYSDPMASYCNGLLSERTCGATTMLYGANTYNMLLVLDQSGSMNDPVSPTDPSTRWNQLFTALSTALPPIANQINFGLELFPYSGDVTAPGIDPTAPDPSVACNMPSTDDPNAAIAVDVATGLDNVNSILSVVMNSRPGGGRPTAQALQQAYGYFALGNGKILSGTKRVLLVTGGGPNCNFNLNCDASNCTQNIDCKCGNGCNTTINCCASSGSSDYGDICLDDAATVNQVERLAAIGVATFVVGLPGSESYATTLNSMAQAGNAPNLNSINGASYYAISAANSLQDLEDTLSVITTQLLQPCDIPLNSSPAVPEAIMVAIDCKLVPMVPDTTPDTGASSGFYIDYNHTPAHLKLTGSYCDSAKANPPIDIAVIPGCVSVN